MLTSEDIEANDTYHHIQYSVSTYELVLQRDLSNRKVRTKEEIHCIFLAWQKKNMPGHKSQYRTGGAMEETVKEECLASTVLG